MKKQFFIAILILLALLLCACTPTATHEPSPSPDEPLVSITPEAILPSERPKAPSPPEEPDNATINGVFYTKSSDFLNSVEGVALQQIAFRSAKAWLSADMNTLRQYYADPAQFELYYGEDSYGLTNRYSEVEAIILKWSFHSVRAEDRVMFDYQIEYTGQDTYLYVTMELVLTDDGWKVDWIGGQG